LVAKDAAKPPDAELAEPVTPDDWDCEPLAKATPEASIKEASKDNFMKISVIES
jgi:hypothetical protein